MSDKDREPRHLFDLDFVWGDTRYVIRFFDTSRPGELENAVGFLLFCIGVSVLIVAGWM